MASSSHFSVSGGSAKELVFLPLVFLPGFFFPFLFLGGAICAATSSISIYAGRVRKSTDGQVNVSRKAARPRQEVHRGATECDNGRREGVVVGGGGLLHQLPQVDGEHAGERQKGRWYAAMRLTTLSSFFFCFLTCCFVLRFPFLL